MWHVEINEQPDLMITEPQIGQDLRHMEGKQLFHCFQFKDDAVFDQKIDSVARVDLDAGIDHRESYLVAEGDAIFLELIAQTRVVSAFQAACANASVHSHRRAKNLLRNRIVQHRCEFLRVPRSSVVESYRMSSCVQSPVLFL